MSWGFVREMLGLNERMVGIFDLVREGGGKPA
jgi:hypothetical protein